MRLWQAVAQYLDQVLQERQRRTGTVTGTSGTSVLVTVGGTTLTLRRLSSYTPTVGDQVIIDCGGDGMVIIGKIA